MGVFLDGGVIFVNFRNFDFVFFRSFDFSKILGPIFGFLAVFWARAINFQPKRPPGGDFWAKTEFRKNCGFTSPSRKKHYRFSDAFGNQEVMGFFLNGGGEIAFFSEFCFGPKIIPWDSFGLKIRCPTSKKPPGIQK